MKLPFKLVMFALVAMLALPLFMVKPDGKPMMTVSDWMPSKTTVNKVVSQFDSIVSSVTGDGAFVQDRTGQENIEQADVIPQFGTPGSGKVYSWKDANGVAHFSEQPPPADIQTAKVRTIPTSVNVMKSVKVPRGDESGSKFSDGAQRGQGFKLAFPSTVPLSQIPKLIEDAKGLQAIADKRGEALGKL